MKQSVTAGQTAKKKSLSKTSIGLVLCALFLVGCAAGIQLAKDQISDPGQLLFNGHTKPEVDCFRCHNGDARGSGRGPDLAPVIPKMPDEVVLKIIAEGETFMPGFADKLTSEEQKQILGWLRSAFGGPKPAAEAVEAVEAVEAEEVKE